MLRFAYSLISLFRCSRNCHMHFRTSAQWKDTYINTIMQTRHQGRLKSLPEKCFPNLPTVWACCFRLLSVWALKISHGRPALWKWCSPVNCVHGCEILKQTSTVVAYSSLCIAGRNAWIVLGISYDGDRTSPVNSKQYVIVYVPLL